MSREARDQDLFDQIAARYARKDTVRSSALPRASQLLTAVQPILAQRGGLGTVIDIGCGIGAPARYLNGRYSQYIGLDHAAEMIAAAQQLYADLPQASFCADNVKSSRLAANSADTILSIGALHHMADLDDVMHSLVRLAKPGAAFVVVEPQNGNPLIQGMRWLRGKIDASYSEEQIFFAESELTTLFARHGIENLQVAFQGFFTPPFAQVILPPQALTVPLSKLAIRLDSWLDLHLKRPFNRLSFNIVITGTFPRPTAHP